MTVRLYCCYYRSKVYIDTALLPIGIEGFFFRLLIETARKIVDRQPASPINPNEVEPIPELWSETEPKIRSIIFVFLGGMFETSSKSYNNQ